MSSYCNRYSQKCSLGCCNISGSCPTNSSNCYYYYPKPQSVKPTLSGGVIAGITIGSVAFAIVMAFVLYCCIRACKRKAACKQH